MFGLEKTDSDFLAGMLLMLAYVGAIMSFMSLTDITKFQLYIRMILVIVVTGCMLLLGGYLSGKGYM